MSIRWAFAKPLETLSPRVRAAQKKLISHVSHCEVRYCRERERALFEVGVEITDILSDMRSHPGSPSLLAGLRQKPAKVILGKLIAYTRKLT